MKYLIIIRDNRLLLLIFLAFPLFSKGQTIESLKSERDKINEEIDHTSEILKKTQKSKSITADELRVLQAQIRNRRHAIKNIENSISLNSKQIDEAHQELTSLNTAKSKLLDDYSSLIRMYYRKKLTENKLLRYLSVNTWEESLLMARNSQKIESHLKTHIREIEEIEKKRKETLKTLEKTKHSTENLKENEQSNIREIMNEEKQKDDVLRKLKSNEKSLLHDLNKKKKERNLLNSHIEAIIVAQLKKSENEISEAQEREHIKLSSRFGENINNLPWPSKYGLVISQFGTHQHPTLPNVKTVNNGIDIIGIKDNLVKAVFDGEVVSTTQIPGNDFMIIIKHGDYYTVYSKLSDIFVSKGSKIVLGQNIGKVMNERNELHFEIWKNKQKLDPQKWLYPR